jgi:hypothetical protein
MIFIINSSHDKFVMIVLYSWLLTKIYHKNLMIWIYFSKYGQFGFSFHENPLYEPNSYFLSWKLKICKNFPQKKLCLEINEIIFTNVLYEHLSFIFGQTRTKLVLGENIGHLEHEMCCHMYLIITWNVLF